MIEQTKGNRFCRRPETISAAVEVMKDLPAYKPSIRAVLFDFDGTISTLRQGWEKIMAPFMVEMITGGTSYPDSEDIIRDVKGYIEESTGIQTIFQMQWLVKEVRRYGRNPQVHDEWWYKEEYNRRLLRIVRERVDALEKGSRSPEDYMIRGAGSFIQALQEKGPALYVASGTDHGDVAREVGVLGLYDLFTQVAGAPEGRADCSKEAVLRMLMEEKGLRGEELLVIGDGKVEIALGIEAGAITIGAATNEVLRHGINQTKREKLIRAGAHMIIGDFSDRQGIFSLLFP